MNIININIGSTVIFGNKLKKGFDCIEIYKQDYRQQEHMVAMINIENSRFKYLHNISVANIKTYAVVPKK